MKPTAFMNGWRDAPHCWRVFLLRWSYLFKPVSWGRTPGWVEFSFFGFTFFWMRKR